MKRKDYHVPTYFIIRTGVPVLLNDRCYLSYVEARRDSIGHGVVTNLSWLRSKGMNIEAVYRETKEKIFLDKVLLNGTPMRLIRPKSKHAVGGQEVS